MEYELQQAIVKKNPLDIDVKMVKEYMRIDFSDDANDRMIDVFLTAAKSFTQSYLKWNFNEVEDIPEEINIAILAITEYWYKNRGILSDESTVNELPYVFSGILDMPFPLENNLKFRWFITKCIIPSNMVNASC